MTDVLVITGLSGAGRSHAADNLEDMGWFIIDNLPLELVPKVAELASVQGGKLRQIGLVVGVSDDVEELRTAINDLRNSGNNVRLLFLDAATGDLVKRYAETRRRHPLDDGSGTISNLIERERTRLDPVSEMADIVINTTGMNIHQLKARLAETFASDEEARGLQVSLSSFGFKQGVPMDVDMLLDVRFLPNPHWVEELRPLTGNDELVSEYVLQNELASEFLDRLYSMCELLLPAFEAEGKSYLSIGIGCTGGRHRSVAIVNQLSVWLRSQGWRVRVTHRDLGAN
jgi:RNase adapter protein RapZ